MQDIDDCYRKLITEICKWGWARVVRDNQTSSLSAIDSAKLERWTMGLIREWFNHFRRNPSVQGKTRRDKETALGKSTCLTLRIIEYYESADDARYQCGTGTGRDHDRDSDYKEIHQVSTGNVSVVYLLLG
jgi:hypothetical protein